MLAGGWDSLANSPPDLNPRRLDLVVSLAGNRFCEMRP